MNEERRAWDRRPEETARAYDAFRRFRDFGALRTLPDIANATATAMRTINRWSEDHRWFERAIAWDDEIHMADDHRRLEAIRTMHENHQRAGRAAMAKGLAALQAAEPHEIPAYAAARLIELGARLERDTLVTSVEDLQGISRAPAPAEDPWEAIARELQGTAGAAE